MRWSKTDVPRFSEDTMNWMFTRRSAGLVVIFVIIILGSLRAATNCDLPKYRIARTNDSESGRLLDISISPSDLSTLKLLCLADALRVRHARSALSVYIFTSYGAASNFIPLGVEYGAENLK